jgi:hypothetical protein
MVKSHRHAQSTQSFRGLPRQSLRGGEGELRALFRKPGRNCVANRKQQQDLNRRQQRACESLAGCLRTHPKGGPVLDAGFRRRDADGCERDTRAPGKIANDRGTRPRPDIVCSFPLSPFSPVQGVFANKTGFSAISARKTLWFWVFCVVGDCSPPLQSSLIKVAKGSFVSLFSSIGFSRSTKGSYAPRHKSAICLRSPRATDVSAEARRDMIAISRLAIETGAN